MREVHEYGFPGQAGLSTKGKTGELLNVTKTLSPDSVDNLVAQLDEQLLHLQVRSQKLVDRLQSRPNQINGDKEHEPQDLVARLQRLVTRATSALTNVDCAHNILG